MNDPQVESPDHASFSRSVQVKVNYKPAGIILFENSSSKLHRCNQLLPAL